MSRAQGLLLLKECLKEEKKLNLFETPQAANDEEVIQQLLEGKDVIIERIVSTGHSSPEGFWYDQARDEWVAVLQGRAELLFESGEKLEMGPGDWVLIPARSKHRVTSTSADPPTIWLAVHGNLLATSSR